MVGLDTSEYASVSLLKSLPSEFRKHCFHYYLISTAIVEVFCAVLMLCLETVEALGSSPDPQPEVLQCCAGSEAFFFTMLNPRGVFFTA